MYKQITDPHVAHELLRANALLWRGTNDDKYFTAYYEAWDHYSPDNFPVNHCGGGFYVLLEE